MTKFFLFYLSFLVNKKMEPFRVYAPALACNLKSIFLFILSHLTGLIDKEKESFKDSFDLLQHLVLKDAFTICFIMDGEQAFVLSISNKVFEIVCHDTTFDVIYLVYGIMRQLLNDSIHISNVVINNMFHRMIEPQRSNNTKAFFLATQLIQD